MKKQSLLQKAKQANTRKSRSRVYSTEEIELVEAWMNDDITLLQLSAALGFKSTSYAYVFIAFVCRQMLGKHSLKK